jgi:hypothetical protein
VYFGVIKDECILAEINIDVDFRSDCVLLHVLKRAELVVDVDAELVDEGLSSSSRYNGTALRATP